MDLRWRDLPRTVRRAVLSMRPAPDPRDGCPHGRAVFWNAYRQAVLCHRCGQVFLPATDEALTEAQREREGKAKGE
jgi:hypothetical protein